MDNSHTFCLIETKGVGDKPPTPNMVLCRVLSQNYNRYMGIILYLNTLCVLYGDTKAQRHVWCGGKLTDVKMANTEC